eukprot:CAMPEP_0201497646 /NCGR_PEP_ID=MMETSP0151_2-20130828/67007_1 /ASSEMBLY_ACC=CAM_ASM_000257 /TAXON_ID=200890 /ORGANISM="Paramoeba atlantica, Strain 621/1 / CCAP 1560/9" /LENGTH=153 /DNA_ID=CAMNT_0047888577 /DNA_START=299 /DNA_END=757 /DNA_ORIENTATION=-
MDVVGEEFQGVVERCVSSGRQYRISFGGGWLGPGAGNEYLFPARSLAYRLACAHIGKTLSPPAWTDVDDDSLEQVVQEILDEEEDEEAEKVVSKKSRKQAMLVLNLDETNVLFQAGFGKEYLRSVLRAVRVVNRKGVGFVFVTLSGTMVRALR